MKPGRLDRARIDDALEEVLSAQEFEHLQAPGPADLSAISEFINAATNAISAVFGELRSGHPALLLVLLLGLSVLAFVIWYGAKGAARRAREEFRAPLKTQLSLGDPQMLRVQAETRASEGDYLLAVRLMFRAKIVEQALSEGTLERTLDAEDFRRAKTYRELVDEFSRSPEHADRLWAVAERIELGLYGALEVGHDDWLKVREL